MVDIEFSILEVRKRSVRVHEFTADLTEFGLWMKLDGLTENKSSLRQKISWSSQTRKNLAG